MKKFLVFIILVILLIDSVSAYYSYGELVPLLPKAGEERSSGNLFLRSRDNLYINNKAPVTTLNYPSGDDVLNGKLIEFSWRYEDLEGDNQVNYQLELDDDPRFLTPLTYYGLSETKRKIYIFQGDRDYYWRIKSKDDFGWGEFSEIESFYLDSNERVCEDGTSFSQCSISDFRYCDNGELTENCALCGCPLNNVCTSSGSCIEKTCFDGTRYGFCSNIKKPNFCQNGEVKEVCSLCGCSDGKECDADGTCSEVIVTSGNQQEKPRQVFKINKFFSFLFGLFFN